MPNDNKLPAGPPSGAATGSRWSSFAAAVYRLDQAVADRRKAIALAEKADATGAEKCMVYGHQFKELVVSPDGMGYGIVDHPKCRRCGIKNPDANDLADPPA